MGSRIEEYLAKYSSEIGSLVPTSLGLTLVLVRVKCIASENSRYFLTVIIPPKKGDYLPKVVVYSDNRCAYCGAKLEAEEGKKKCLICGEEFDELSIVCSEGHYICNKCYIKDVVGFFMRTVEEIPMRHYGSIVSEIELESVSDELDRRIKFRDAFYPLFEGWAEYVSKEEGTEVEVDFLMNVMIPDYGKLVKKICLECDKKCETVVKLLNVMGKDK